MPAEDTLSRSRYAVLRCIVISVCVLCADFAGICRNLPRDLVDFLCYQRPSKDS